MIHGDCLDKLRGIEQGSVDLVYLDPPFFTEKVHTLKNKEGTKEFSFDDSWGESKNYANFLKERLEIIKTLLKDSGSVFVHCDKSGEHIVRAVLDQVFGANNFQSEIIWTYKRWSNSRKGLLPSHQNIYFYSKTKDFKFNEVFTSYSETTNIDQILQRRTRDEHNKSVYDKDAEGNIKNGDKKKGVPLSDVWDIPYLNPKAKERVGYPTQKPILLLEQIIKLVTNEGDLVIDPFCGSGTTCVASKLLNRNYIGIDQSLDAVELSICRLKNPIRTESSLLKKGRSSYNNADQEVINYLRGVDFTPVHRNRGIDAILTEQFDKTPILIRKQKSGESIDKSLSLLAKAMKTKNSKKAFLIKTTNDVGFFDTSSDYEGIQIVMSPALQISNQLQELTSGCTQSLNSDELS